MNKFGDSQEQQVENTSKKLQRGTITKSQTVQTGYFFLTLVFVLTFLTHIFFGSSYKIVFKYILEYLLSIHRAHKLGM